MANFQDSRFFGMSPRAVLAGVIAVAVVVGLFFIPETVKFLFDAKPRQSRERVAVNAEKKVAKPTTTEVDRAALAPDSLNQVRSEVARAKAGGGSSNTKQSKKPSEGEDSNRGEGLFSGWNFRVKAGTQGSEMAQLPQGLTIDRISSKDGIAFLRRGSVDVRRFVKTERVDKTEIADIAETFIAEIEAVGPASAKGASADEITNRLRTAHVATLRALYRAGADRGFLMRWIEVPVVKLIDERGGVGAVRKLRASFAPRISLSDVSVRQRQMRGWGADGRAPASVRLDLSVKGTDIDRIVVYANGKQVRDMRMAQASFSDVRTVTVGGDAYGVWSFVVYDKYGTRPYTKSYSFYPRVRAFSQAPDGTYQIAFMQGSARNSLDRYFFAGASSRPSMTSRDPFIARF
jgi:hypothetical protein